MHSGHALCGLLIAGMCLSACSGPGAPTATTSDVCVDIPDSVYFQMVDGRFVPVTPAVLDATERPAETSRRIASTLAGMGYPWVSLQWDGEVVTVSGLALDENTRSDAFIATKSAFEADPVAGPLVQRVVNEMTVRDAEGAIAVRLSEELAQEGFSWLRVELSGKVATLIGTAPTTDMKELAYRAGRDIVESDLSAGEIVNIVVDAISVRGGEPPPGAVLIGFGANPTIETCEQAFSDLTAGRQVAFFEGESVVENSSARLLDAATGIALMCERYPIEIANYVSAETPIDLANDLSQRRASAVKDYLMAYGANADLLTARGYGQRADLPVDSDLGPGDTEPTIEFTVRPGTN